MSRHTIKATTTADLMAHPAVKAWRKLAPGKLLPEGVAVVTERSDKGKRTRKSEVYQLDGVGIGTSPVIAKRCQRSTAMIERIIYEEVLEHLPVTVPHYYGCVEDVDGFFWLFIEDVGDRAFSPLQAEHRRVAARWLGVTHTLASRMEMMARLPARGLDYYLGHLRLARHIIQQSLETFTLSCDDIELLRCVVSQLDIVEAHWTELEACCREVPWTLIHGDFSPKNVRVREDSGRMVLLPFDWETGGWGVPVVDLAQFVRQSIAPEISDYVSIVRECWPHLRIEMIQSLANTGRIFRSISSIGWEAQSLSSTWVTRTMNNMQEYSDMLDVAICAARLK